MSPTPWIEANLAAIRPHVLAALTRYFNDLDRAEDGFQEACLRALRTWPRDGRPADPIAWLVLVGRNAVIDALRRERRGRTGGLPNEISEDGGADIEAEYVERIDTFAYRDDVLRLLFICCHPNLPLSDQLALALKIVAGLTVDEIARAFLVSGSAMEQRITRAKRKVARANVPFHTPSGKERGDRLKAVAATIYLLFNEGYSASGGTTPVRIALCEEAIRLARLLLRLFPGQSEIMGLLALCLFQHSRARARLGEGDILVPLEEQDRDLWDGELIAEGRVLVEKALRKGSPGPYQIQAAIAAVHCTAARVADTDWHEIARLYAALEALEPSPVVALNRAVAVAKSRRVEDGLAIIAGLEPALSGYLYFHTTRAALLAERNDTEGACKSYRRALELKPTAAEATYIQGRLDALGKKKRPSCRIGLL